MKHPPVWLPVILLAARIPAQNGVALEPRVGIERRLAGGESHSYLFSLQAGQYARISVDQRSIAVAVGIFGPDGSRLFEWDYASIGSPGIAEMIGPVSGTYRARVSARDATAPEGHYKIVLSDIEAASESHRMRVAAARSFAMGMALSREGTHAAMLKAIARFDRALADWRSAGARAEEAATLSMIGLTYAEAGDLKKALSYTVQALPAVRSAGDRGAEGRALEAIGEAHTHLGNTEEAVALYGQALELLHAAGDRAAEANALNNLGVTISRTGDKRKALVQFEQASRIYSELQDRDMAAEVAGNIGLAYDSLGEYRSALEIHQRNLKLWRERGDRTSQAIVLNNIGMAQSGLGAYQNALDAYTAALEINRKLGNRWSAAINLNNLAWVYANLGERRHALRTYGQALEIFQALNDRRRIAAALNNIAGIHADLGEYRRAIELHQQALPLRRASGDADGEANSLNNLGKCYARLGERERARGFLERALAIHRTNENRYMLSRTLVNLGALSREAGNLEEALPYLDEALAVSRAIHEPNGESAALAELARVERERGDFARAHQRAAGALAILESTRLAVMSPALRASLFAEAREIRELDIDLLMRLHREDAALTASERGRARSLLELLGESRAEIRQGADESLLARERELYRLIAGKADRQARLLSARQSEPDAAAAAKELDALAAELDEVQSRIRETSPRYAALTQPVPLGLSGIQAVLDGDTALLEYSLGSERSFLFVVTATALKVFDLPPRAEIESAAKRVYGLLTSRNHTPAGETADARAARVRRADAAYPGAALRVSRMLLAPAAAEITGKRLVIAAEGLLQYLPFAALPDPAPGAKRVPLVAGHEILSTPSASVLAAIRRELAERAPAPKSLAVLADPVFSANDPRLSAPPNGWADTRSAGPPALEFTRLRFSRVEAEAIAQLAPAQTTLKAFDFDASRDTALSPELGRYRIVHFATHSVLDDEHPELSGVVLSLVDRQGRPRNGFLRLYDVYNLRLRADLVVLSACRTALGREISGEGLIGLTRGFLYAGAPRVVATLWEIGDRATAEAMKRFYERMLKRDQRPAAALRSAQEEMRRAAGWESPYYWAAFTLQGEWR